MTTPHWAGRLDYGLLAWWGIFMPFLQMHPFFHGNSIKKRLVGVIVSELNFAPLIVSELLHISDLSFLN